MATAPRYRPVSPPKPKTKTIPRAKSIGVVRRIEPFQMVRSQLRNSSSAGKLMIRVSTMKPWPSSGLSPVMNM